MGNNKELEFSFVCLDWELTDKEIMEDDLPEKYEDFYPWYFKQLDKIDEEYNRKMKELNDKL